MANACGLLSFPVGGGGLGDDGDGDEHMPPGLRDAFSEVEYHGRFLVEQRNVCTVALIYDNV